MSSHTWETEAIEQNHKVIFGYITGVRLVWTI